MRTVPVEVNIDLDDYADEFLENASDKELKAELEKRGYEVFKKKKPKSMGMDESISFENPDNLKRHLCDIVEVGYFASDDELLNAIRSRL